MVSRFLLPLLLSVSLPTVAATFTVTSGADSGPGTLRQAILDANANPGRDQIVLQTDVGIDSSLPDITDPIDITGAQMPSGRYEINVNLLLAGIRRLNFVAGSDGSTVTSIIFGPFESAIRIGATDVTVTNVFANNSRVDVAGDDNMIGGLSPVGNRIFLLRVTGDRNVIRGNIITTTQILSADDTQLGSPSIGNDLGEVVIQQSLSPQIHSNSSGPISISQILTPGPGPVVIGNSIDGGIEAGLDLDSLSSALISGNTITGATGIEITNSTGVEITANNILATGLAIDLDADGFTANDPAPDADLGANSRQNFPLLTSVTLTPGSLVVQGTLASAPLTPYRIELFTNEAANADARTFFGAFEVTTDATGNAAFTETFSAPFLAPGDVITATATNLAAVAVPGSTPNSTSEVSLPLGVTQPGSVGFETSAQSVDEEAGTVTITVTRTGGSEGTVTVDFATSNGTATAPTDYTSTSGTLTFGPGVTERTIVVPIADDALPEPDETFTVTLSNPTGGAALGTATTTITITAGDAAAEAQVPTASTWALIMMVLGLAWIGVRR